MAAQVHVGDVGTVFESTITDQDGAVVDVGSATLRQLLFRKPSGATLTKVATLLTTGADGKIKYTSIAGDLNESGKWEWQGYVEFANGQWHSDRGHFFQVDPNIA